ncbi:MAG: ectonucleotide pyrophosphatase/phosphodiesterase [Ignavibacteriaceae bacterium]
MRIICFILIHFLLFLSQAAAQNLPNYTILVSFDGFRWDYPNRGITPTLNSISESGISALSLQPSFPTKTFPNHYTIVTGLYPQNHGIISNNMYDPVYNEYFALGKRDAVENSRWYKGEAIWETARKQGLITASYFWPGSELDLEYRRPDYFHYYDHNKPYKDRINGIIEWLKLPYNERPKFITVYFDAADTDGHKFGPDSEGINKTIMKLDSLLGDLLSKLEEINLKDSINIIIVSDHGMNEISDKRIINVDEIISTFNYYIIDDGPFMFIYPEANNKHNIYSLLKENENNYKVYLNNELPTHYNLSGSHLLPEIIVISNPGWSLVTNKIMEKRKNGNSNSGNHGYDNYHTDMHGILYAMGPSFKRNYKTGTVLNIDIYPLLCKILNIKPKLNIDGKLERIQAILKEY